MTSRLAVIKDLRDKGASIKMIDDVAAHVGGYDNPVFVATVELIIKIKNMAKSVAKTQDASVEINSIGGDESVKDANYRAAENAIQNDDEMSDDERKKMLEHLAAVENAKDSYLEADNSRDVGDEPKAIDKKDKKKREAKTTKNSLLDKMSKIASQMMGQKQEKQQQQQQVNTVQQNQQRNSQVVNQQQTGSLLKVSLTKMRLLSGLKVGKDRSIYGDEQWRLSQVRPEVNVKQVENSKEQKTVKPVSKTSQELISSKAIDQIIKNDKPKNTAPVVDAPPVEKGKFTQQVSDKPAPKANEEAVAKMQAKEAIAKLQSSGMRTTTPETPPKAEIDKQLAQAQAQTQTAQQNPAPQKQR